MSCVAGCGKPENHALYRRRHSVGGRMPQSQIRPKGRLRFAPSLRIEESLSLAAFVMSLGITLINVYYAMRGSEIAVDPPTQLILYRDGIGEASVLIAAFRVDMINTSDGYGDVLKGASLSMDGGQARFDYQGTLKTVFANNATERAPACELGARCLQLPGLYVVERSDEILDMPSGAARGPSLSVPLVSWNCVGGHCDRFETFGKSLRALPVKGLSATIRLRFHSDGERVLHCKTGPLNLSYLQKVGWISLPCGSDKDS